jgi:hypothetical protein
MHDGAKPGIGKIGALFIALSLIAWNGANNAVASTLSVPQSGNPQPSLDASPSPLEAGALIAGTPPTTAVVGQPFSFQPSLTAAGAANGGKLKFFVANKPSWASFNSVTGQLWGVPQETDLGSHEQIMISANDGTHTQVLRQFAVNVMSARKSHYGHYFSTHYSDTPATAAMLCEHVGVRGVVWHQTWNEVEPTRGVYNFKAFDKVLAAIAASRNPQCQLWLFVEFKSFRNSPVRNPCPVYLQARHSGLNVVGGRAASCFMWESVVANAYVAMMKAAAAHFDRNPHVEGFILQESSLGFSGEYSQSVARGGTYTPTAWRNSLVHIISECGAAFSSSRCVSFLNFLQGDQSYLYDISAAISAVLCVIAAFTYLPATFGALINPTDPTVVAGMGNANPQVIASVAVIIGIVLAGIILWLTGYFTGTEHKPVKTVGESSLTGAATVILSGISIGFESAVYTALVIAAAVFGAFTLATGSITVALFAVALAGTGLLTTVGVIVAMDTFGPVSDNAQGIAEMSGDVEGAGVGILTELDAVGNTTKAITKGIAIATAVLAATALFGSYRDAITTAIGNTDISAVPSFNYQVFTPSTLVGVIIGASVVFMFSGLAINAVTRAAGAIVFEVRRQFRDNPGIMEGTVRPEYGRVVDICTRDSLRELATPGLLAILAPIAVGFGLGVGPLAGYLAGAIATGTLMAIFLANSGGAWDNGKKLVEDGNYGGKGSDAHAATVIGDTVGDPFKDTAGPAINPLIKVMNLVSLLIATSVVKYSHDTGLRAGVAIGAVAIVVAAVVISKRRSTSIAESGPGGAESASGPGSPKSEGEGDEAESGDNGKESADTAAA